MNTTDRPPDSPYGQSAFNNVPFSPSQSQYALNGVGHAGSANLGPFSQAPTTMSASMFQPDAMGMGDYNWNNGDVAMSGSFQQPFVPQDLWQMPMTLEWDWADVLNTSANLTFDDMAGFSDGTGTHQMQ